MLRRIHPLPFPRQGDGDEHVPFHGSPGLIACCGLAWALVTGVDSPGASTRHDSVPCLLFRSDFELLPTDMLKIDQWPQYVRTVRPSAYLYFAAIYRLCTLVSVPRRPTRRHEQLVEGTGTAGEGAGKQPYKNELGRPVEFPSFTTPATHYQTNASCSTVGTSSGAQLVLARLTCCEAHL